MPDLTILIYLEPRGLSGYVPALFTWSQYLGHTGWGCNTAYWFAFGPGWPHFGPVSCKKKLKLGKNGCFHWCVHLLCECSELNNFWAMLVKSWPFRGRKTIENGGFRNHLKKYLHVE